MRVLETAPFALQLTLGMDLDLRSPCSERRLSTSIAMQQNRQTLEGPRPIAL